MPVLYLLKENAVIPSRMLILTQLHLRELAKHGNASAIADMPNQSIQQKGLTTDAIFQPLSEL